MKLYAVYELWPDMMNKVLKGPRCKHAEDILGRVTREDRQDRCPTILGVCRIPWKHEALCGPKQLMAV
ncbi:hypothetical protein I6J77_17255 [Rhodanobacter sp. FDAARGOS 1247]|nr:hypothetical protein [Rhodanobacter sp. FDAARGOS 1247]QRP63815.1 hypothetical protein I6J77_17255 [Rhodanobacter sp. FDAARGOS 1247]